MLLLRLIQKLVRTLNSDGTPGQIAFGIALGAAFGLTPLLNLHNVVILGAIMLLNVSFPAAMLGSLLFAPLGFALDPLFHRLGSSLLGDASGLVPAWTQLYNMPVIPLSNYNNTIVLGSLVGWLVLSPIIFLLARWGVASYRKHVLERLRRLKLFRAIGASKVYNAYRLFRAD